MPAFRLSYPIARLFTISVKKGDVVMGDVIAKPADADTPAQSFPERLMGIFISPAETLADVARKPDFVAPLYLRCLARSL